MSTTSDEFSLVTHDGVTYTGAERDASLAALFTEDREPVSA